MSNKRSERLDIRLTLEDRLMLERIAKAKRRTMTSLFDEWVEWLREQEKAA